MTAEERIAWLEEQLKQALTQVQVLQEQLAAGKLRSEELEKQKTPPPGLRQGERGQSGRRAEAAPQETSGAV